MIFNDTQSCNFSWLYCSEVLKCSWCPHTKPPGVNPDMYNNSRRMIHCTYVSVIIWHLYMVPFVLQYVLQRQLCNLKAWLQPKLIIIKSFYFKPLSQQYLREQGSWGLHGAHLGPTGLCWPPEPYCQGYYTLLSKESNLFDHTAVCIIMHGIEFWASSNIVLIYP